MSGAPGIACRLIDDAAALRPRRKCVRAESGQAGRSDQSHTETSALRTGAQGPRLRPVPETGA